MTYIKLNENKEVEKKGNLKELILNCSNPELLSEEELKKSNIYNPIFTPLTLNAYEYYGDSTYTYNEATDEVLENRDILTTDLEQFKATILAQNKQTLTEIQKEGFTTTTGIKIGSEEKDKTSLLDQLQRIERKNLTGSPLVDFDNEVHNLSIEQFEALVLELGDYLYKLFMNKQTLRGLINIAISHEQVENLKWRTEVLDENGLDIISYEYNEVLN